MINVTLFEAGLVICTIQFTHSDARRLAVLSLFYSQDSDTDPHTYPDEISYMWFSCYGSPQSTIIDLA